MSDGLLDAPIPTPRKRRAASPDPVLPDANMRLKAPRLAARTPRPKRKTTEAPTAIYRAYDRFEILLYVGVSSQVETRLKAHARDKIWWRFVERVDVCTTSGYGDFLVDEYEACVNEYPLFNTEGVPWRGWRPSTGREDFDTLRDWADIEGAVARLDAAGVRGRLRALNLAFPADFGEACAAAGTPAEYEDLETWERQVLTYCEGSQHVGREKKKVPVRRPPKPEKGKWAQALPPGVTAREFADQMLLAVDAMTDEEARVQSGEIAEKRPLRWGEARERVGTDREAIRLMIELFLPKESWPIVVVPPSMRAAVPQSESPPWAA